MSIANAFDLANDKWNAAHPVTVVYAGTIYKGIQYTAEQIKEMRDWVKDCQWGENYEESEIDELTALTILKGVDKNYEGGLNDFDFTCKPG